MSDASQQETTDDFDVVIVGGGPGGYGAALYGASAGLSIAMVEKDKVGGTCLHRGCIPAKELLETAHVRQTVLGADRFGITIDEPKVDWSVTQTRKQKVIDQLHKGLSGLIKQRKIETVAGFGTLNADRTVTVELTDGGTRTLRGDTVILATGSVPRTIPGFEPDGTTVCTSDEFLELADLPRRAVVIGGGAIGCEFASTLSDMGAEVTILEALPKILPGLDADVTKAVLRSFKKKKIDVRAGVKVTGHTPDGSGGTTVNFGDGESIECDMVVVSVGRRPLTDSVLADGTGVELDDRGFLVVDETCRTTVEGVWAIGDCIATPQLAHVGFAEGICAIGDILGEHPVPVDYANVPWAIYCQPEVAFAGLSEEAAKEAGFDVVVSNHRFIGNSRAQIIGDTEGLVKIIAEDQGDGTGGRVLGVHMVGPWVTEQLGQGYLAVNWEATVDEIAHYIQPHPSLSELFGESVLALTGRSLHG
ncbi:MAG: dihydrolipoyl dehydrogenase [Microthrixaceae bacterium]|nr:dihydrolipoyl dehydrogenase [Microthrixaceae bacterium]